MSHQSEQNPWHDENSQQAPSYGQEPYQQQPYQQPSHDQHPSQQPQYQPPSEPYQPPHYQNASQEHPPGLPPRRTSTDLALPTGQERTEQIETLQSYEGSKPQSEDDRNQETLQREFPNIDGSLIAAIYSDSKSLGATREMLQELSSTS